MLKFSISGAMVAAAIFFGGDINARVSKSEGFIDKFYDIVSKIDRRLSRIEGKMKIENREE